MIIDNNIVKKNNTLPKMKPNNIQNNNTMPNIKHNNEINHYKDIMNTKEMNLQSYELLEQRYKQGLISLDEFTKKCNHLQNLNKKQ